MSKGSKRRSAKQIDNDFKHVFSDLEDKTPVTQDKLKPWLDMMDDEIDKVYWNLDRADLRKVNSEKNHFIIQA